MSPRDPVQSPFGIWAKFCLLVEAREGGPAPLSQNFSGPPRLIWGAKGVETGSSKNAVNLCGPAANLFVHGVSHKFADFGPNFAAHPAPNQFLAISHKTAPKTSRTPLERCGMKS